MNSQLKKQVNTNTFIHTQGDIHTKNTYSTFIQWLKVKKNSNKMTHNTVQIMQI